MVASACGTVHPSQAAPSSRTNSQSPSPSPVVASSARQASPSPAAVNLKLSSADTTRLGFQCRLPFSPRGQTGAGIMAGFIAFPAAEFSSDPAAATSPASENRYLQQPVVTPA